MFTFASPEATAAFRYTVTHGLALIVIIALVVWACESALDALARRKNRCQPY